MASEIGEGNFFLVVDNEIALAAIGEDFATFGSEEVDDGGFDLAPGRARELHLRISSGGEDICDAP